MQMEYTAQQIASFINGTVEGNPQTTIHNVAGIEQAEEGYLSFMANPKYEPHLYTTRASVLIVADDLQLKHPIAAALIRVPDPYSAFSKLLEEYSKQTVPQAKGIHDLAFVDDSARCGDGIYVGPHACVAANVVLGDGVQIHAQAFVGEGTTIGAGTVIHPGAKIYHKCEIGANCIIHAGTIIGSDGFGFAPQSDGTFQKIPQIGNVIIGDEVEIGSNCSIDRATIGSTVIKDGVKLDNLIQVAHNVVIEENTVIAAQTGISGSTKIGKNCMIGGQVGFVGHIVVADGSKINAQSGVAKSIKNPNTAWNGTPARGFRESYKTMAHIRQIPNISDEVKALKLELEALKKRLDC